MIDVQNVCMSYGPTKALDGVSFSVKEGEILGLLGPNGAGKSTLMKILTTYICPLSGTVKVGGHDVVEDSLKVREAVGYLPENVPLYMDMRVDEYLTFVAEARGMGGARLRERLEWVRTACGLVPVWKHAIQELSKGFRQRVGLAQAIIHDPKVLILDEPTNGFDPVQIIAVRKLIKTLAAGRTIIFSTHILQEVEAVADRIVIIHEGHIVAQGARAELAEQAMHRRTYILDVREDFDKVRRTLNALSCPVELEWMGPAGEGYNRFEVRADYVHANVLDEVARLLKEQGWTVRSLAEKEYTLEEMFIGLLTRR